jgi:hypothetical protein
MHRELLTLQNVTRVLQPGQGQTIDARDQPEPREQRDIRNNSRTPAASFANVAITEHFGEWSLRLNEVNFGKAILFAIL